MGAPVPQEVPALGPENLTPFPDPPASASRPRTRAAWPAECSVGAGSPRVRRGGDQNAPGRSCRRRVGSVSLPVPRCHQLPRRSRVVAVPPCRSSVAFGSVEGQVGARHWGWFVFLVGGSFCTMSPVVSHNSLFSNQVLTVVCFTSLSANCLVNNT